jgi:hypothetical protein
MSQPTGMMKPTWLDEVIDKVIEKGDPTVIAQAIANSPRFLNAIKAGLANKPQPGLMAPSHSQVIRQAIAEVVTAD